MNRFNEYGRIQRIALRRVEDAFGDQRRIDRQWRGLGYHDAPNFRAACKEYEAFLEQIQSTGARVDYLPPGPELSLDSIYVRDATLVSPGGVISCAMGKDARVAESALAADALMAAGLSHAGMIGEGGRLEGGDFVWFDAETCAVGRSYRTNDMGIRGLRELLGKTITLFPVQLPHYKGPSDVFHLMSVISPLDENLALAFSPLLPVSFREWLLERGIKLVEVPEQEFETMGCNVLALAPRRCLMVEGNPETRRRLERAGCEARTYPGWEISRKGEGGPTCLTRPLVRL